jgi:hypothetical protein
VRLAVELAKVLDRGGDVGEALGPGPVGQAELVGPLPGPGQSGADAEVEAAVGEHGHRVALPGGGARRA